MMLKALALATTIWTLQSGPVAKPISDQKSAPSIAMRWDAPPGLRAAPMTDPKGVRIIAPVCQQTRARSASAGGALFQGNKDATLIAGTRKLGKEPAADAIAAVLYTEGQCSKPILVSRDIGTNPKAK